MAMRRTHKRTPQTVRQKRKEETVRHSNGRYT